MCRPRQLSDHETNEKKCIWSCKNYEEIFDLKRYETWFAQILQDIFYDISWDYKERRQDW